MREDMREMLPLSLGSASASTPIPASTRRLATVADIHPRIKVSTTATATMASTTSRRKLQCEGMRHKIQVEMN